ncbi:MAG: hypothetical protein K0S04_2930 [Herbinix sp.]|nr:hypothetical protein [Herbinix sp.]
MIETGIETGIEIGIETEIETVIVIEIETGIEIGMEGQEHRQDHHEEWVQRQERPLRALFQKDLPWIKEHLWDLMVNVCLSDPEILEDACSDLLLSGWSMEIAFGSFQPLPEDSL